MTWSVSTSGPVKDVAKRVTETVVSSGHEVEAHALAILVNQQMGPHVSISGSGSGGGVSLSISSFVPPPGGAGA